LYPLQPYERLDFRPIKGDKVRIETDTDNKVQLIVKITKRDPKTNKLKYETVKTINIVDATADQVVNHVEASFKAPTISTARPAVR
jgi:putative ribosome biogenesis GTPase RsgA